MGWLDTVEDTNFVPLSVSYQSRHAAGIVAKYCTTLSRDEFRVCYKISTLLGSVTRGMVIYVTCQCVNATFFGFSTTQLP